MVNVDESTRSAADELLRRLDRAGLRADAAYWVRAEPPPAAGPLDRLIVFFDRQTIGPRLFYSRALSAINKAPAIGLSLDQIRFTTDLNDVPTNVSIGQFPGAWSSINFARIPNVAWQEEVLVQRLSNSLSERLKRRRQLKPPA